MMIAVFPLAVPPILSLSAQLILLSTGVTKQIKIPLGGTATLPQQATTPPAPAKRYPLLK